MIYSTFIDSESIFLTPKAIDNRKPKKKQREAILSLKSKVDDFECQANLHWLSRISDDGDIVLMLADNAYNDICIDDIMSDLQNIYEIAEVKQSLDETFTIHQTFSNSVIIKINKEGVFKIDVDIHPKPTFKNE